MGIIRKLAVRSYHKELINFIETLKTFKSFGEKEVSNVLIFGIYTRAILELDGFLYTTREDDGSIVPELIAYPLQLEAVQRYVNFYAKEGGHEGKVVGLAVWLHTLRGTIRPEIMPLVREMWEMIMESKSYWDESLKTFRNEDLRSGIDVDTVNKVEAHTRKIMSTLPPKELDLYK